ncbi:putative fungal lipase-like domain, alpha/Beta hydrolase [Helianthus anomalus]
MTYYALSTNATPSYIVAYRGTLTKGDAFARDLQLDLHCVKNILHQSSRFETVVQAVRNLVASGDRNIWLIGHSLGSAMAMLAGKSMARNDVFLESHFSIHPGLAVAVKAKNVQRNIAPDNSFSNLASWVPCLYVNPRDHICSEYIGYFQHRRKMEGIGARGVERLSSQHSFSGLLMDAIGKESHEPLHIFPSANLICECNFDK